MGALFSIESEPAVESREKSMLLDLESHGAAACNPCTMFVITVIVVVVIRYHSIVWNPVKNTSRLTPKSILKRGRSELTTHAIRQIVTKEVLPLMNSPSKAIIPSMLLTASLSSLRIARA